MTQVPAPDLVTAVPPPPLSTTAPAMVFAAVLDPVSVSVLAPDPLAVNGLVRLSAPVPDASMVAPPVVPAKSIPRSLLWPDPVYCNVPAVAAEPMAMVPFAAVVGAPRALLPPPTLARELMLRVPAPMVVGPLYVLAADKTHVPPCNLVKPPVPKAITPGIVFVPPLPPLRVRVLLVDEKAGEPL